MARQWVLNSQEGFEISLEYKENVQLPSADELRPTEVLVKVHAASLNYRDIMFADGTMFGAIQPLVVPACDGAGVVEAVGSSVHDFQPGDRVVTYIAPKLVDSSGNGAFPSLADAPLMLGQGTDGTLRSRGVFSETALVHAPSSLGWLPASTLSCTWLTAWNVLFGLKGQEARPGSWILVQGTGGVSIATLQLAVAAGINVVASTSTEAKEARLQSLGAKHTVNYHTNPKTWGQEARRLSPGGNGFDIVIDVGGDETLSQSLAAVRVGGTVLLAGAVGKSTQPVPMSFAFVHTCTIRGIIAGSRGQLEELVRYIDEKSIKPIVDDIVFELAEAKDAYRRLKEKKHFAKVCLRIDHPSA